MSVKTIFLFIFSTCLSVSYGQKESFKRAFECGLFGGGSYYIGDLNPSTHFLYSKPAAGAIIRYNLSTRHSLRFTGTYGNVHASDANAKDQWQINRNLSFNSKIIEVAAGFEVTLKKYSINKTDYRYRYTPYFFYEVAFFRMNPMVTSGTSDVELSAIGTEGQNSQLSDETSYSMNQISFPVGIGFKFNLMKRVAMSFEYGIRMTFTDYLDDVSGNYVDPVQMTNLKGPLAAQLADPSLNGVSSQFPNANRGNDNNRDWYSFYGVMLTIKPWKKNICDFGGSF